MVDSKIGIVPLNWKYLPSEKSTYVSAIAKYGFKGIQISMEQGKSPDFLDLLLKHNVEIAEIYVAVQMTPAGIQEVSRSEAEEIITLASKIGVQMIVFAVDGSEDRDITATRSSTAPKLSKLANEQLAEHINRFAKMAKDSGIASSFHPHAATYVESQDETERLLALLSPDLVGLCLDVGHWIVAGEDPIEAVVKYNKRITHIHVKDVSAEVLAKLENKEILSMEDAVSNYKLFVPAGTGLLELENLLHQLQKINYSGWLMSEQDSAWEPAEAASGVSYAAIKKAISGAM